MSYMVTNVTIHTWQQKIILTSSQQVICGNKIILHKKIIVYCCCESVKEIDSKLLSPSANGPLLLITLRKARTKNADF